MKAISWQQFYELQNTCAGDFVSLVRDHSEILTIVYGYRSGVQIIVDYEQAYRP